MGQFVHACEGEMVCKSINPKIPYFNAPIFLENKAQIGKVDEILGPLNEVYFTVKVQDGIVATSFKPDDKVYIATDRLLPLERFLPKPKAVNTGIIIIDISFLGFLLSMVTYFGMQDPNLPVFRARSKRNLAVAADEAAVAVDAVVLEVEAVVEVHAVVSVVEHAVAAAAVVDSVEAVEVHDKQNFLFLLRYHPVLTRFFSILFVFAIYFLLHLASYCLQINILCILAFVDYRARLAAGTACSGGVIA